MRIPFIYLFILLLSSSLVTSAHCQVEVHWKTINEDLSVTRLQLEPNNLFSPELLMLKTALKNYRVAVLRSVSYGLKAVTAKQLAKKSKAVLTINANFFDEKGDPLGLVISQGILQHNLHRGGRTLTGIFFLTRERMNIVNRTEYASNLALEAIQAGPRLITDGTPVKDLRNTETRSRRAGLCIDQKQNLIFFISTGFIGMKLSQLQHALSRADLACREALNLDGGGSAQLFLNAKELDSKLQLTDISVHGTDKVPVLLALLKI